MELQRVLPSMLLLATHHVDLGLSVETITAKGLNNFPLLKAGDNTLVGNINRIQKHLKHL
ncbi:hypothetical protein [Chryseobacterium luteum]|uniref:Uncharacterized protein n=1 Tax=Chryseobacterium luteum TaxID=421531 RepID=A0A085ZV36_9FLAO|nr:hypothetical protein [Chryseobacterium luteum]KFF08300.1 hypothetical protein IX38_05905 [Chryseobacterium luteum]